MYRSKTLGLLAGCFLVAFLLIGFVTYKSYVPHPALVADEDARLEACRQATKTQLKSTDIDLKTMAGIHGLCYVEVNEANLLRAFTQQTAALYNQQNQLPVILWMVVAITLSGVGLAGLQLYGAFVLSSAGKAEFTNLGGGIDVSNKRLSVNSSVTGLMILVISFAFFYVFVKDVYLIQEVKMTPNASFAAPAQTLYGWGSGGSLPSGLTGTFFPPPTAPVPQNQASASSLNGQREEKPRSSSNLH